MGSLRVVGLGRGDEKALELILKLEPPAAAVICASLPGHLAHSLQETGLKLIDFEDKLSELGRLAGDFSLQETAVEAARSIVETWEKEPQAVLALPGKPERSSGLLQALRETAARNDGFSLEFHPGEDIRGELMDHLEADMPEVGFLKGVTLVDGYQLGQVTNVLPGELIITGIHGGLMLSRVRDELLRWYPLDHPVHFMHFDEKGTLSRVHASPLASLAQADPVVVGWMNLHLPLPRRYSLGDMIVMMEQLRAPDGCPWDRQQDHKSLKPYLIEEAYEVLAAIEDEDPPELCEELGDLLLQVVFHSCLAREQGDFDLWDVIDGITRKIYRRHPHVFADQKADTAHQVSLSWQAIKQEEKKEKKKESGRFVMPESFPALMKAQKVQKRAADVGFDWPDISGAFDKVQEEIEELKSAYSRGDREHVAEEMGDLFFALVNIARFMGVDSEMVLHHTVEKFKRRFQYIEEQVQDRGGDYSCFTLKELDHWWDEAKTREKK